MRGCKPTDDQRFIADISFRYIRPQTPMPRYLRSLLRNLIYEALYGVAESSAPFL